MFYQVEIKKIEKTFGRYMFSIGVTGQSFVVQGTEMGLKPALQALQDLCDKVVSKDHVISRPGMEKFFNSEKGKEAIRSLQKTNKVICVEPRYIKSVALNEQSYGPEASSRILYTGQISGGPIVKVFVGDITKHRVDAIVNAANGKLEHIGGLAAAIVTAGKKGSSLAFISQSCHVPCMYSNSSKLSLCSLKAVSLSYMMSVYVSVLFFCLCKLSTSNY
jgi:poly [ADP-ribose] polymerase 10/14/15